MKNCYNFSVNLFICDVRAVKIVLKENRKVAATGVESGNKRKSGEYNEIGQ